MLIRSVSSSSNVIKELARSTPFVFQKLEMILERMSGATAASRPPARPRGVGEGAFGRGGRIWGNSSFRFPLLRYIRRIFHRSIHILLLVELPPPPLLLFLFLLPLFPSPFGPLPPPAGREAGIPAAAAFDNVSVLKTIPFLASSSQMRAASGKTTQEEGNAE